MRVWLVSALLVAARRLRAVPKDDHSFRVFPNANASVRLGERANATLARTQPGAAGMNATAQAAYMQWVSAQLPLIPVVQHNPVLLGLLQPPVQGNILEFGVYVGTSINLIAQHRPQVPIYGFDSFEGLPDAWIPGFPKGYFNMDGKLPPVAPNVVLVKGWFDETLPPFVQQHPEPVSYLHIDCDMYESTKTVFQNLAPRIVPGTVIVFDELVNYPGYQDHELKAFYEFLVENGRQAQWLGVPCPIDPSGNVASCAGMGCCSVAAKITV